MDLEEADWEECWESAGRSWCQRSRDRGNLDSRRAGGTILAQTAVPVPVPLGRCQNGNVAASTRCQSPQRSTRWPSPAASQRTGRSPSPGRLLRRPVKPGRSETESRLDAGERGATLSPARRRVQKGAFGCHVRQQTVASVSSRGCASASPRTWPIWHCTAAAKAHRLLPPAPAHMRKKRNWSRIATIQ